MEASSLGQMKRLLAELRAKQGVTLTAVISHTGVPVAWEAPEGLHLENFAMLCATLAGSSELLFQGLGKRSAGRLVLESNAGVIVTISLGPKAFLAAFLPSRSDEMLHVLDAAAVSLRGVLRTG